MSVSLMMLFEKILWTFTFTNFEHSRFKYFWNNNKKERKKSSPLRRQTESSKICKNQRIKTGASNCVFLFRKCKLSRIKRRNVYKAVPQLPALIFSKMSTSSPFSLLEISGNREKHSLPAQFSFVSFLPENSKGIMNKLKVHWLKWLSVHQTNGATCGCDNEITVRHNAYGPGYTWMIPHLWLILLRQNNECHLTSTINTPHHIFSKVWRKGSGEGFIVEWLWHYEGPKKSHLSVIYLIIHVFHTRRWLSVHRKGVHTNSIHTCILPDLFGISPSFPIQTAEQAGLWWPLRGRLT